MGSSFSNTPFDWVAFMTALDVAGIGIADWTVDNGQLFIAGAAYNAPAGGSVAGVAPPAQSAMVGTTITPPVIVPPGILPGQSLAESTLPDLSFPAVAPGAPSSVAAVDSTQANSALPGGFVVDPLIDYLL
jgi:hypothetical protein